MYEENKKIEPKKVELTEKIRKIVLKEWRNRGKKEHLSEPSLREMEQYP